MTKLISILILAICLSGRSAPIGYMQPRIGGTNLSAWWTFNDGSTTRSADFSPFGGGIFLVGTPTVTNGIEGKGIYFGASGKYGVQTNAIISTNVSSRLTISFWVYPYALANADNFVTVGHIGSGTALWGSQRGIIRFSNSIYFWGANRDQSTGVDFTTSAWQHIGLTVSNSTIVIYKNGSSIYSGAITGSLSNLSSYTISIGRANLDSFTTSPAASFDDIRIYNSALTADEIKLLYGGGYGRAQ